MRSASLCFFKELPFTFNMVLTTANHGEIGEIVELAARLGSRGVRFGHLLFTPENSSRGLALSPSERRKVEDRIWSLRKSAPVVIDIAPGYFSESPFFPCGPLTLNEYNLDYGGNFTLCCHLSGYAGPNAGSDVLGNLHEISLSEACLRFEARVATYLADKRDRVNRGAFSELDHFPCWYCVKYLDKVTVTENYPARDWLTTADENGRRLYVLAPADTTGSRGC
jgi:MoaA/NifB/PqqE/SkfB family radical SAM enzyme